MKKKSLLITILISVMVIIILIIAFTFLIKDNNKRTNTTNKVVLSSVTKLLKKDYLMTNAVFGNPTTADNDVTIDSIKYDMVTDISSISDLQKLIKSTYTGDILSTYLLELDKYNKFVGVFSAIIFGIIAHFLNSDYSFYGVGITFLFYVFNKNKCLLAISFIIATLMQYSYLILVYYNYGFEFLKNVFIIYLPYFICTIFSIIIILCYNKKKGPSTKYFFYLFYPLHMILIYILSFVLQN